MNILACILLKKEYLEIVLFIKCVKEFDLTFASFSLRPSTLKTVTAVYSACVEVLFQLLLEISLSLMQKN